MDKLKVLDLFSGIGGFSLGLERAGMETVAFCEIDNIAQKVLRKHWRNTPCFEDVSKLRAEHDEHNWAKVLTDNDFETAVWEKIDVICGGFPCQDISVAGKQKGLIDDQGRTTRSGLWFEYKRLIKEIKPKYVLIENVANIRSKGLITVLQDLWELGYDAEWHVISAKSVGSWHERKRLWIIAFPHNHNFRFSLEASATKEEKQKWWAEATSKLSGRRSSESALCGTTDALPGRLDQPRKQRIKQLGNAVIPLIPELIGRAIVQHEANLKLRRVSND